MYRRLPIVLTAVLLLSLLVAGLAAGRTVGDEAPGPVIASQLPLALADAEGAAQAVQVILTFEPGDVMPTHQHGGKVLVSVIAGELTIVRADGSEEAVYAAGETWVEEPGQQHWAENRSDSPVILAGTFLLPEGATPTEFLEGGMHPEGDGPDITGRVGLPVQDAEQAVQVILQFAPGAVMPMHQHGGKVLVSVAAGELTVIRDGGAEEMAYPAGETWIEEPGQQHWAENRGEADVFVAATFLLPAGATPTEFIEMQAAAEAPTLATASAVTELSNQFGRTIITARGNTFLVDSAPPLGHPAEEMNPVEAMMASLATCGLFIYETAAQEMDIPLSAASMTVQADFDVRGLTGAEDVDPHVQEFRAHLMLEGPSAEQADALFEQWSLRCPIYTTLIQTAPIEVTVNDEEMGGKSAEGLGTLTISASLSNQPGRAIVTVRNNYLIVDSVPPLGGPNLEVNPMDLLLAAQGSCGAVIMERAAIDNAIELGGVTGTVSVDFDARGMNDPSIDPSIQAMRVHWEIDTENDADAHFLIDEWLRRCPIYNTLRRAMDITVTHKLAGEGEALLNISFTYDMSAEEFQAEMSPLTEEFAGVEGLLWKIWAVDEEESRFNGTLLFADAAAMNGFLEGDLAGAVMSHEALSEISVNPYTILAEESRMTRAPLR